ncbi:Type 1 glutamine amidotransferase-like domain-containing protein [Patescibacteria group bacterium]
MKLLLTSNGLTNKLIADALFKLVDKKPEDISLVFVPTASNMEAEDKGWLIDNLIDLKKQNFKSIDIVDISAMSKDIWLPRFEEADVLFFGGGNEYHLMRWLNKSGLSDLLPELLKTKVYVGLSAGSVLTGKDLLLETSQLIHSEDLIEAENMKALGFVNFYFLPHLNSNWFEKRREKEIKQAVQEKGIKEKVYVLDDDTALKITDGKIEVVGEGKHLIFNDK